MPFIELARLRHGDDIRFTRRSIVIFVVSCLLLCVVGAAVVVLAFREQDAEDWVAHTIEAKGVAARPWWQIRFPTE